MSASSCCNLDARAIRRQRSTIRGFFPKARPLGVSEPCRNVDATLTRHGTAHADLASAALGSEIDRPVREHPLAPLLSFPRPGSPGPVPGRFGASTGNPAGAGL
jgi:hypothetical protein